MKSTVTKIYDYTAEVIPEALRRWRITDSELAQHMSVLSQNHAFETEADTVMIGDSVRCTVESACERWNRPLLLLYPGENLCPLEAGCVGMHLGESRKLTIPDGEVTITVVRILRRSNMPVSDTLVRKEQIQGVTTLDAYYAWYRRANEPARRQMAVGKIAYYLASKVKEKSEYLLDADEEREFVSERVNCIYDAMIAAGMDPKIPSEGFDFLTEDEAKAKMAQGQAHFFREYVSQLYLIEHLSGRPALDLCHERMDKLASENGMSREAMIQTTGYALGYGKVATDLILELLSGYAEQFVEE